MAVAPFGVRSEGGVFHLSGDFDMDSVSTFATETASALDGLGEVVLDLADLRFVDSSGLNAIIRLAQRVGGRGFVVRNPQPRVAMVFQIARLADVPGIEIETRTSGPEFDVG